MSVLRTYFPSELTELITEYKEDTFRVPKGTSKLQLIFDTASNNKTIINVPCEPGLWVIERTKNPYLSTITVVLRKRETTLSAIEVKLDMGDFIIDFVENITICAFQPLIAFNLQPYKLYSLYSLYQLPNNEGIALAFFSSYELDKFRYILQEFMVQAIHDFNPSIPLVVGNGALFLDVNEQTVNKFISNAPELKDLTEGMLRLEGRNSTRNMMIEYKAKNSPNNEYDYFDYSHLSPSLSDILAAVTAIEGIIASNMVPVSRILEMFPSIKAVYKRIVAASGDISYKDVELLMDYREMVMVGKEIISKLKKKV